MIVSSIVLAYHGCDYSLADSVINRRNFLESSRNAYDWLGHGVYFWENSPLRALQWAEFLANRPNGKIKRPAVIGAIVDLGNCLDMTDQSSLELLRGAYLRFKEMCVIAKLPIPQNKGVDEDDHDLLLRYLDCAVVNYCHASISKQNEDCQNTDLEPIKEFDSVRGVFYEGAPLFDGSKFREKTHIQIAVRNPDRILGYFWPKDLNE